MSQERFENNNNAEKKPALDDAELDSIVKQVLTDMKLKIAGLGGDVKFFDASDLPRLLQDNLAYNAAQKGYQLSPEFQAFAEKCLGSLRRSYLNYAQLQTENPNWNFQMPNKVGGTPITSATEELGIKIINSFLPALKEILEMEVLIRNRFATLDRSRLGVIRDRNKEYDGKSSNVGQEFVADCIADGFTFGMSQQLMRIYNENKGTEEAKHLDNVTAGKVAVLVSMMFAHAASEVRKNPDIDAEGIIKIIRNAEAKNPKGSRLPQLGIMSPHQKESEEIAKMSAEERAAALEEARKKGAEQRSKIQTYVDLRHEQVPKPVESSTSDPGPQPQREMKQPQRDVKSDSPVTESKKSAVSPKSQGGILGKLGATVKGAIADREKAKADAKAEQKWEEKIKETEERRAKEAQFKGVDSPIFKDSDNKGSMPRPGGGSGGGGS